MTDRVYRFAPCLGAFCVLLTAFSALGGVADSATVKDGKQTGALDFKAEMESFFGPPRARYPGSPENLAIEEKIASLFAASGFTNGAISFRSPVLKPGAGRLIVPGAAPFELYPLHPTLVRPGNFPATNFTARLIYLGRGDLEAIEAVDGIDLKDAIAVMEFDSNHQWLRLLRFGMAGFIFIGAEHHSFNDARGKLTTSEVPVPRYYVPQNRGGELRQLIARGPQEGMIAVEPMRWENGILRNLWVIIPGSDPSFEREVVVFTAPIDANCLVPDMAYGGQAAANLGLLIRLLRQFAAAPPARSVMLVAVNGHTLCYLGERMLAWHLAAPSGAIEGIRSRYSNYIRYQTMFCDVYGKLKLRTAPAEAEDFLISMRTLEDKSTGRNIVVKNPLVALIKRDLNRIKAELMALQKRGGQAIFPAKYNDLNDALKRQVNLLALFNKAGLQTTLSNLKPNEVDKLETYIAEIVTDNRLWIDLNQRDLERDVANGAIRTAMGHRSCAFAVSLDLTWTTPRVGFSGLDEDTPDTAWSRGFGVISSRVATDMAGAVQSADRNLFMDTMTSAGGMPQEHFYPASDSPIGYFHAAGVPAFSLRNVYAFTGRAFTPDDTVANLDTELLNRAGIFLPEYFRALLGERQLTDETELPIPKVRTPLWTAQVWTYEFDPFSASVIPDLRVTNSFVILYHNKSYAALRTLLQGDVSSCAVALTDQRAGAVFYGVKGSDVLPCAAYRLAGDWRTVDRVIDAGDIQAKVGGEILPGERTMPLFPCQEIMIYDRVDPSMLSTVALESRSFIILGASQNVPPRRYGFTAFNAVNSMRKTPFQSGPGAVYVEPGERIKIMTNQKRMVLNVTTNNPEGAGINASTPAGQDFFFVAAGDLDRLNRHRLKTFRGVTDELVANFLARGAAAYAGAKKAIDRFKYAEYIKQSTEAIGSEAKAYTNISDVRNDMLKAVIFYMALLLPFCFFVQKLLFKTWRIEVQMGLFSAIFILTFVLFRLVHPAFHVAQSPEAIFIAFVMGMLGLFVISILHGRFEGEMHLLFTSIGSLESGAIGYSAAGQQAMLIGVNNMKRRRVRTTLTTATIVLVTFTMLAFTSVSRKMSPTTIPRGKEAPYTGVFYQWPGSDRMDEPSLDAFTSLFAGDADKIVVRRWFLPSKPESSDAPPLFCVNSADGMPVAIEAVLGLPKADDGFLAPMPLLPGGRWFGADDALEVVLPSRTAEVLKISADEVGKKMLSFGDMKLLVVGILNDERFAEMRDLNEHPLMPIKAMQTMGLSAAGETSTATDPVEAEEAGVFYAELSSMLIIPLETSRKLGAQPYSVSARLKPDFPLWRAIDRLLLSTEVKFFVGSSTPFQVVADSKRLSPAGIYYIGTGYHTSVGGMTRLIIPLLIAATIILNTMLGSVYERKAEISIYNAVGLNPTHIGMFFLAEAFVYSVIGSIGGYLIGQLASMALVHFNLIRDINLNFSSLSVVYVIMFTIAVVLLSTLYPAIVASRASVPSGKRKWSMPQHDGQNMEVVFPFIYPAASVPGIMHYLEEYFALFSEASLGELIAQNARNESGRDEQGREVFRLAYDVALAPYDLGVTQKVTFAAAMNDLVRNYGIRMTIARVSGQDSNWVTTNKPFLERLRKYLMNWRNLSQAQRAEHIKAGRQQWTQES